MINTAFTTDNIQVTTGDSGCHELALLVGDFFEAAEAAAVASLFPVCHCCAPGIIVVPRPVIIAAPFVAAAHPEYVSDNL